MTPVTKIYSVKETNFFFFLAMLLYLIYPIFDRFGVSTLFVFI